MGKELNTKTTEKTVFIFDADEGMVLSKDVTLPDGHMVAAKGTELNLNLITRISNYHILEISVYEEVTQSEQLPTNDENITYYNKVRQTEQFKEFHESYNNDIETVTAHLNHLVLKNEPVDTTELLSSTADILNKYDNTLQIFDMLHCMRDLDDLTYVHSVNVALIASIIGKWLNYSEEDVKTLALCGLLHDIGKILIPDEILSKPDRLTDNEFAIMKNHVNLGYAKIKDEDLDSRIKEACLLHHEKCDGSGYPFGLPSDQIPDFTKIVTIADVYDAMTCERVYRDSICPFEVIKIMESEAYTKYDPKFILPFLRNVVTSYIHTNVKLSDGRICEVVMINRDNLSLPVVKCGEQFIDLSKEKGIKIVAVL